MLTRKAPTAEGSFQGSSHNHLALQRTETTARNRAEGLWLPAQFSHHLLMKPGVFIKIKKKWNFMVRTYNQLTKTQNQFRLPMTGTS